MLYFGMHSGGAFRTVAEEIYIELSKGKYIQAIFSKPADVLSHRFNKSLLICAHDFPGHFDGTENIFSTLQDLFLEQRHAAIRFNWRGYGKSDGNTHEFSLLQAKSDLEIVLKWAEAQGFTHTTIVTEGLGLYFIGLEPFPKSVKNLVFLWPAFDSKELLQRYFRIEEHKQELDKKGFYNFKGVSIGKNLIDELLAIDPQKYAKSIKLPTLAFHGKEDKIVPISNLKIMRDHLGSKRIDITTFDDGTHGLPLQNHRKAVATHILHFIERFSLK